MIEWKKKRDLRKLLFFESKLISVDRIENEVSFNPFALNNMLVTSTKVLPVFHVEPCMRKSRWQRHLNAIDFIWQFAQVCKTRPFYHRVHIWAAKRIMRFGRNNYKNPSRVLPNFYSFNIADLALTHAYDNGMTANQKRMAADNSGLSAAVDTTDNKIVNPVSQAKQQNVNDLNRSISSRADGEINRTASTIYSASRENVILKQDQLLTNQIVTQCLPMRKDFRKGKEAICERKMQNRCLPVSFAAPPLQSYAHTSCIANSIPPFLCGQYRPRIDWSMAVIAKTDISALFPTSWSSKKAQPDAFLHKNAKEFSWNEYSCSIIIYALPVFHNDKVLSFSFFFPLFFFPPKHRSITD